MLSENKLSIREKQFVIMVNRGIMDKQGKDNNDIYYRSIYLVL